MISARSDDKRRRYFGQLLEELEIYQEKLRIWQAPPQVTEPVHRLAGMLHKYQHALTDSYSTQGVGVFSWLYLAMNGRTRRET